ncbi:FhuB [Staphylococcus aureus]|nr:FhuB [Staphylococcus aureus]
MTNRENPTPLKFLSYIIGLSMILLITLFISTLIGDAKNSSLYNYRGYF